MKAIRLFLKYAKINLMASMEYRTSFFAASLGMALSNSTFVFFWWIVFEKAGARVGGYDFRDVMFIWALASSAFGLAHVFFAGARGLSHLIVTGELDTFLLQPKDPLLSLICARTDFTAWGDLLYGIVLMAMTGQGGIGWAYFSAGTVIGAILFIGIEILAHSLTFYLGDANSFGALATEFVINFSIYPEGIYPMIVRAIMATIIPATFITHMPLRLARGGSIGLMVLWLAFAVVFCLAARWFFYRAKRRYESGNLIITRM